MTLSLPGLVSSWREGVSTARWRGFPLVSWVIREIQCLGQDPVGDLHISKALLWGGLQQDCCFSEDPGQKSHVSYSTGHAPRVPPQPPLAVFLLKSVYLIVLGQVSTCASSSAIE